MKDKRTPRPENLTNLIMDKYLKEGTHDPDHSPPQTKKEIKETIEEYYIREYIERDYHFLGNRYTLEEFSNITNIPMNKIYQQMAMETSRIGMQLQDNTVLEGTLRAILQQQFMGALGNRAIAQKQYSILAKQQGDTYVPFLTSAVNQSISMLFQADDQTLKILKTLLPSNGIEALMNTTDKGTPGKGLTASRAVELLKAEGPKPLIEAPDRIKALEQTYNLGQMPQVLASRQSGIDTSKEALGFDKITEIQLEAMEPEPSQVPEPKEARDKHINRRAHEVGIDLGADEI